MKLKDMVYADGIAKQKQIQFSGYNHSHGAGDGELWDMENMTSDYYPLLASRRPRIRVAQLTDAGGLFSFHELCWVAGGRFYYGGEDKGAVSAGQKIFGALGEYVLIFPDKCYYNRVTDQFGSLEARWQGQKLTFGNGLLFEETAAANCVQANGVDWSRYFRVGDAVTIAGCTQNPGNNTTPIIRGIDGDKLYFSENIFTLGGDGTQSYTETGALSISRTVPQLRFVCENEGRLWGCTDRALYACTWQDPFNWNIYDGLDSDSWEVTPQSTGEFTGMISYKGYVVAKKEEQIYKVYGSTASTYQLLGSASLGLAEGSHRSMAIAGETLFYLNRNGIMAYGGGIPQPICEVFGMERYCNGVAGSDGLKYYVSMQNTEGLRQLFVHDTQKGLWHKEDDPGVLCFCRHEGVLYMLTEDGSIWACGGSREHLEGEPEPEVAWMAETTDFTEEDPNKKGVSKVQIRLELEEMATAQVWIQYDSDGLWHKVGCPMGEHKKRSYYLPVVPRRCDHYRIRITGTGACRIHSLVREVYAGSEARSIKGRH